VSDFSNIKSVHVKGQPMSPKSGGLANQFYIQGVNFFWSWAHTQSLNFFCSVLSLGTFHGNVQKGISQNFNSSHLYQVRLASHISYFFHIF